MPLSAAEAEKRLISLRVPTERRGQHWAHIDRAFGTKRISQYAEDYTRIVGQGVASLNLLNRRATLNAIAGPLRPALENALKIAATLPYQTRASRVPFRAKNVQGAAEQNMGRVVQICAILRDSYDQPIEWFAEWCGYIERNIFEVMGLDVLLAAEIDSGNRQVLDILLQSAQGSHPVGIVSQTGLRALLRSNQPQAWQVVEKLLLGAERAEGLRQAIMECVDELNPAAFQRFVRIAIEHNLLRFSSVLRAFIVWFPGLIEEGKVSSAEKVLMRVLEFLRDSNLEPNADFNDTYLRLWADAYLDAEAALRRGWTLMSSGEVEVRRAVACVTAAIQLTTSGPLMERILRDPDLRVSSYGVNFVRSLVEGPFASGFQPLILDLAQKWPEKGSAEVPLSRKDVWHVAVQNAPLDQLSFFLANISRAVIGVSLSHGDEVWRDKGLPAAEGTCAETRRRCRSFGA